MTKSILENKKVIFIISFILIIGLCLQIFRSEIVLNTAKNENLIHFNKELLTVPKKINSEVASNPQYCIVFNDTSLKIKNNIMKTLDYLQKSYKTFDTQLGKVNYSICNNIMLTTSYLEDLGTIDEIESFVKSGGKLFLTRTLEPTSYFLAMSSNFGIIQSKGFTETSGLHFNKNALIGATGLTFIENQLNDYSLNVNVDMDSEIYITSTTNTPILWKSNFGEGSFIICNANFLFEKISRGVLTGMLSIADDTFIYPIFNSKVFFIDDFPSPIAKGNNDIIYKEFQQDLSSFYRNIWWPNMIQAANNFNLVYTGALIQTYTDDVDPPFSSPDGDNLTNLIKYGRELILGGGELGLHGYNHQAYTLDKEVSDSFGYNVWNSVDDMKESMTEVRAYVKRAFPSYTITSYVPPSNVLSQEGRVALKETIPELLTISSLYTEDESNRAYIQEFEIAEDGVIEMPRISSGYFHEESSDWEIANAITSHGVFSHFVHPDDVISSDRSKNTGWTELYEEFTVFMDEIHKRYPWLRSLPATDAALVQASTLHSTIEIEETNDAIKGRIQNFSQPQYFILRSKHPIQGTTNCTVEKIDDDIYLVYASEEHFKIGLKRSVL